MGKLGKIKVNPDKHLQKAREFLSEAITEIVAFGLDDTPISEAICHAANSLDLAFKHMEKEKEGKSYF